MTRFLPILALLISACGGAVAPSTTTVPPPPGPEPAGVLLVAEFTGGCAMIGPNCERLVIYGDGTVEAHRLGSGAPRPVDDGSIDPALVVELHRVVVTTDLEAMRLRLPAGECQGCVDGIDSVATFTVDGHDTTFSSIDTGLVISEPVFAAMWAVIGAARDATEIPLIMH
jgi:hypothetical protein